MSLFNTGFCKAEINCLQTACSAILCFVYTSAICRYGKEKKKPKCLFFVEICYTLLLTYLVLIDFYMFLL